MLHSSSYSISTPVIWLAYLIAALLCLGCAYLEEKQ